MTKILIGSDANGFELKENLKEYLLSLNYQVIDVGVSVNELEVEYPDVALALSIRIADGETDRGILICGTGLGMAIAANKVPGVRAATAHDPYSAERIRKSNDAQVITFGAQIIAPTVARVLLDHWLASEFQGGRSTSKVERIKAIEKRYLEI